MVSWWWQVKGLWVPDCGFQDQYDEVPMHCDGSGVNFSWVAKIDDCQVDMSEGECR
jgi:hypothetical protein